MDINREPKILGYFSPYSHSLKKGRVGITFPGIVKKCPYIRNNGYMLLNIYLPVVSANPIVLVQELLYGYTLSIHQVAEDL